MPNINEYETPYYESIEFNLATGQTNYNLDTGQATFLTSVGPGLVWSNHPTRVTIRTDKTITVRFNSTSNHGITVASGDSPFEWEGRVQNIFITNASGFTAAIKIICRP